MWDGSPVPSVTQIIGTWSKIIVSGREYYLNTFTGDIVEPFVMERARDWGIAVHQVAAIIMGGDDIDEMETPPELVKVKRKVMDWRDTYTPEIVCIEQPCYSAKYRYAGTPDIVCRIKGSEGIIDIKTGSSETVGIQTAAYCQMVYGRNVKRWLMEISKPRDPIILKFMEIRSSFTLDWSMFLSQLNIYNYKLALTA
jgi:hypothetical protein